MKHFLLLLLAGTFFTRPLSAQTASIQEFIEQHKNDEHFIHAFLSKDLFEVAAQTKVKDEDWNGLHNVVKNIGSLQILAGDSISDGLSLYKEVRKLIPGDEFDELLTVRDGKENVRIWVKSENQVVSDLILLVGAPDEFVLVCFNGVLELGNLGELAALFEDGSAQKLAKASESVSIDFGISPNPGKGPFQLSYSDELDPPTLLTILDQNGRQVKTIPLSGTTSQQLILSDLNAGVYWLQLKTQKGKVGVKQIQIVH